MALFAVIKQAVIDEGTGDTLAVLFGDASAPHSGLPFCADGGDDGLKYMCSVFAAQQETAMAGEQVGLVCGTAFEAAIECEAALL